MRRRVSKSKNSESDLMKTKGRRRGASGAVALLSFVLLLSAMPKAFAQETDSMETFSLDSVLVTASRMEKNDLEVPASVRVYTAEDLEATGASNVLEALKFSEGIVYHSQGPAGQSLSTMTSKVIVRGLEKGMMILVNGVPVNLRGAFSLEDMALGSVERIEVLKGNGSVLYGSEASGGVINIITMQTVSRTIDLAGGDLEKRRASISWQEGKLGFTYSQNRVGNIEKYGDAGTGSRKYWTSLDKSVRDSFFGTYKFNENWSITEMYSKNHYSRTQNYQTTGAIYGQNDYHAYQNRTFLTYHDDTVSGNLYTNRRSIYNRTVSSGNTSSYKDKTTGLEMQKRIDLKKGNIMTGFDVHKEEYYGTSGGSNPVNEYDRMSYSAFAQWNNPLNNRWEMDLGVRASWTGSTDGGNNYDNISPQVQFLYKADENTSYYTNIGKSFVMPYLNQVFGSGIIIPNLDLKPQTGWQYEVGVKHIKNIHAWKAAIFYMNIKDNISYSGSKETEIVYTNEDFRNVGLELSYDVKLENGFSLTTGATFSRPQVRGTENNNKWIDKYGRYQFNFGLGYQKDKWQANLNGNFLGDRTTGSINNGTEGAKALFFTSMHVSYKPTQTDEFYFNLENVLDRHAPQTHSSVGSYYYQTPRNFELGYKCNF